MARRAVTDDAIWKRIAITTSANVSTCCRLRSKTCPERKEAESLPRDSDLDRPASHRDDLDGDQPRRARGYVDVQEDRLGDRRDRLGAWPDPLHPGRRGRPLVASPGGA